MFKVFKYKVYNSKKQRKLHRLANTAGWVHNYCISLLKRYYRLFGKSLSFSRLKAHIAKLSDELKITYPIMLVILLHNFVKKPCRS